LALWQTRHVTSLLSQRGVSVQERIITTRGDVNQSERLQGRLEKGFFTEELENALRAKVIDWAVHSLKDLPTRQPDGLTLAAILTRAPASDLLLVRKDSLDESKRVPVKAGGKVGSSSLRREALLKHFGPHVAPGPLRGNVPTRVEKLRSGAYDAIVLAEAGVSRLELPLDDLAVFRLSPRRWPGAPGQGAVAVQCRADDAEVRGVLAALDHAPTRAAVELERELLRELEGGCTTPFGCYTDGERVFLGLAAERGWVSLTVPAPAALTPEWLKSTLEALNRAPLSPEESDEWFSRRV
jgi:hydroxymethylbilane synthase